jgi:hypothetical protein
MREAVPSLGNTKGFAFANQSTPCSLTIHVQSKWKKSLREAVPTLGSRKGFAFANQSTPCRLTIVRGNWKPKVKKNPCAGMKGVNALSYNRKLEAFSSTSKLLSIYEGR